MKFTGRDAVRIGLAAMFMFTGANHFLSARHAMAAMIPPPLTGAMWVIYATGVLELAGAVGLLVTRWRTRAAWGLIGLLVAMFPANVYSAVAGIPMGRYPPIPLWIRTPVQLLLIAGVWWSTLTVSPAIPSSDRGAFRDRSRSV